MVNRRSMLLGAVVAPAVLAACGGAGDTGTPGAGSSGGGGGDIEVFSWWTSGSEADALQVLIDKYAQVTGAKVNNAAVSGGGGSNARQALATRLQGGDPPDSWQIHPDQDTLAAVQDGTVTDISALWQAGGWEKVVPPAIAEMVKSDGKFYSVPVNAHRANALWTNPKILSDNGITWDATTTPAQFLADAKKLSAAGITPICLGDKDIFAASQLLETLIMAQVGAEGWKQLATGDLKYSDDKVKAGVQIYVELIGMANKDHSTLTWDQAAQMVGDGKAAANLMGDWAYGELLKKGFKEGEDFSSLAMPGTAEIFDFVGDAFVKPAKGPNPTGEDAWLNLLLDQTVQRDFNLKKGSTPIRTDVDTASFPPYQQAAAADFRSKTIVSSLAHFQIAPAEFAQSYADAVTALNGDLNVDNFVTTMTSNQESLLG